MKLSEKFLKKYTDEYASFGYKDKGGTYSSAGLEIEYVEYYGRIKDLEARLEKLEYNKKYIPEGEYIAQMGNITTRLKQIEDDI